MIRQIDRTYLSYIFDGLDNKTIYQDNISAFPEGLIGVYEEAIPNEYSVYARDSP